MKLLTLLLLAFPFRAGAGEIEIKSDWLQMTDGVKLSVTYFLPDTHGKEKIPVVLEMLPYRKDDEFLERDYSLCEYFARNGIAVARVDVRGTGSSGGKLPPREYSEIELKDAVQVIDLLSKQPWSNGNVGMYGISWSGFNAIMTAMRKPKALKAILSVDASDDLFHDDVHFIDGIFHVDEYSLDIDHANGLPQSPEYALDEAYFKNRFEAEPWIFTYKANQKDGPFWRKNSLRYQKPLEVPAFLIGGLLDGYRDSIPRMLERSKGPVKAMIGPWNHTWPDNAEPGPAFEWRTEALRWWNHWLRGKNSGILEEPRLSIFVRKSHKPDIKLANSPGGWRFEDWPIQRKKNVTYYLKSNNAMSTNLALSATRVTRNLSYKAGSGLELGYWWGETTPDMSALGKDSLIFQTEPLDKDLEFIGSPRVQLLAAVSAPLAHWVARLESVDPDGAVSFVTGGAINGAQRDSRTNPKAIVPGEFNTIKFDLHFSSWTFPKGSRIRLSLSNSAFPMLWPTPYKMESSVQVVSAKTFLIIPVIPPAKRTVPVSSVIEARRQKTDASSEDGKGWSMIPELAKDGPVVKALGKGEESKKFGKYEVKSGQTTEYTVNEEDPAKATFVGTYVHDYKSDTHSFKVSSRMEVESDATDFRILFRRVLQRGDQVLKEKTWEKKIPRAFQ